MFVRSCFQEMEVGFVRYTGTRGGQIVKGGDKVLVSGISSVRLKI